MTLPGRDRARTANHRRIASRQLFCREATTTGRQGWWRACASVARSRVPARSLCDITVMGIRAEESAWFDIVLSRQRRCVRLARSGLPRDHAIGQRKSLEATLIERGFDPLPIRERRRTARTRAHPRLFELHIEQGPTLVAERLPAAVVTGIRGCKRFRNARCIGQYGHSGRRQPPASARCGRGDRGLAASSGDASGCSTSSGR